MWLILSSYRLFSWSSIAARSADPAQFIEATRDIGSLARNPRGGRLGIVGFGRIDRRIAEKTHNALGMDILYHDVVQMSSKIEAQTKAVYCANLEDLIEVVDCIVLATPFEGRPLLNADMISKVKWGAKLVNIARGRLVNETALLSALRSGQLSAAGLDVHWGEPQINPDISSLRNVEITCHNAGASLDSHMGFERLGMETSWRSSIPEEP